MHAHASPVTGAPAPLVSDALLAAVEAHGARLDAEIDYARDFDYDYFGFKTLERSYLLRARGRVVERPQHMLMRVALGIHYRPPGGGSNGSSGANGGGNSSSGATAAASDASDAAASDDPDGLEAALRTYRLLSGRWFTHASPTLFNAGTPRPQLSSCFLVCSKGDSIEGIYDTLKECAVISKSAGGIGLSIHDIRATGSYIRGTNGASNGVVPMLRVFNDTARYVDQGGGKRKGAFAVYLEPWHADVFDFLDLRKNHGKEEARARDLFYALWVPDLFMRRVEAGGDWSLFCPNEAPGLADVWGEAFERLYARYEAEGRARKVVRAQQLWFAILEAQVETGAPFMLYKDACNAKSNHRHLGTIKCSNLCTEIVEYTAPDETAVCNLASIALPRFVREKGAAAAAAADGQQQQQEGQRQQQQQPGDAATTTAAAPHNGHHHHHALGSGRKLVGSLGAADRYFDFDALAGVVRTVTANLDRIIDVNYYPVEAARRSNLRHRPVGIGVQGLADAFLLLGLPFDSPEARQLNKEIFEAIYFNALSASSALAKRKGPYATYAGSPVSQGILQHDMWGVEPPSKRWDWDGLRAAVKEHGVRNSLLVAPMPTASTSQVLGNNECFEPYTSNIYVRRVLSGEFTVVNQHLLHDLAALGLWSPELKNELVAANGSVQGLACVPPRLKALYRTVWEVKQRAIVDMAADRGAFVDQSQSLNVHMSDPNFGKLTSLHFYAWRKGLKTGMYYLRTRAAADAIKFTVDTQALARSQAAAAAKAAAAAANGGGNAAEPQHNGGGGGEGRDEVSAAASAAAAAGADALLERERQLAAMVCSLENKDACLMCGS